jgi:hypothetical protein
MHRHSLSRHTFQLERFRCLQCRTNHRTSCHSSRWLPATDTPTLEQRRELKHRGAQHPSKSSPRTDARFAKLHFKLSHRMCQLQQLRHSRTNIAT